MVKDSTTSQLDFLSLEEVSDKAAETISGGLTINVDTIENIEYLLIIENLNTLTFDEAEGTGGSSGSSGRGGTGGRTRGGNGDSTTTTPFAAQMGMMGK